MSVRLRIDTSPALAHIRTGGAAGVRAAADMLLNESRALAPVDSGRLRASGGLQVSGLTARVSYDAPYAAVVHERQVKYLETPANDPALQGGMLSALARALQF